MNTVQNKLAIALLAIVPISLVNASRLGRGDLASAVTWENRPIKISLSVEKIKLVRFPHAVSLISEQDPSALTIHHSKGKLYLRAHRAFSDHDMYFRDKINNEVYVLTLSSSDKQSSSHDVVNIIGNDEEKTDVALVQPRKANERNYVSLSRYAIQKLFSDERFQEPVQGLHRVPMRTKRFVDLIRTQGVTASPVASWASNNLYVTAVEIHNNQKTTKILDPRQDIRGFWNTATFYPTNTMRPVRTPHDSTMLILTSHLPFQKALYAIRGGVR